MIGFQLSSTCRVICSFMEARIVVAVVSGSMPGPVEAASWWVCGCLSSTNEACSGAGIPLSRLGSSHCHPGDQEHQQGLPLRHPKKFKECRSRAASRLSFSHPLPTWKWLSSPPPPCQQRWRPTCPSTLACGATPEPPLLPRGRCHPPSRLPACLPSHLSL